MGFCPTTTQGATSQRPTQGAGITRTSFPKARLLRRDCAPASSHAMESQTRTVRAGGAQSLLKRDRKSTRLNSSHLVISYAVFCLKKKKQTNTIDPKT